MPASSMRSLSPLFIRAPEVEYGAPLVTVATTAHCDNPPTISAGEDQSVEGLESTLAGTATSECDDALSYQWSYLSGPGTVTFGTSTMLSTTATASMTGVYTFKLTVTDGHWTVSDYTMAVFL